MSKFLCCDGPLNGRYHELSVADPELNDVFTIRAPGGILAFYRLIEWPTGERVLTTDTK